MIRAAIELVVLGFFVSVLIAWCEQGGALVQLARLGGW